MGETKDNKFTIFLLNLICIFSIFLLTGCDNKECIKSHKKMSVCTYTSYTGKQIIPIVIPCEITICDEYENKDVK